MFLADHTTTLSHAVTVIDDLSMVRMVTSMPIGGGTTILIIDVPMTFCKCIGGRLACPMPVSTIVSCRLSDHHLTARKIARNNFRIPMPYFITLTDSISLVLRLLRIRDRGRTLIFRRQVSIICRGSLQSNCLHPLHILDKTQHNSSRHRTLARVAETGRTCGESMSNIG